MWAICGTRETIEFLQKAATSVPLLVLSVEKLRAAIEPFTFGWLSEFSAYELFWDLHEDTIIYSSYGRHLTAGDFRRTVDALVFSHRPSAACEASSCVNSTPELIRLAELGVRYQEEHKRSAQVSDHAPYCQYCGAKEKQFCNCGPIVANH